MTTTAPDTPPHFSLKQAVTGLVPPQTAEAHLRTSWPAVTDASPGLAALGSKLIKSKFLAPLAWMLLAPLYFKKLLPFIAKRYTLTNRRLMIQRGIKPKPSQEVKLEDIDDIRLVESTYSPFYRAATLEVISGGKVVLTLGGVPDPESFRQSVLNTILAWVPGKAKDLKFIPASSVK